MGVSRRAYQELIDGDIEWLLRQPRDLERDHIEAVLRKSVELLYGKEKQLMEVLKDISQLTKGCGVTFIKNDDFHYYEYLMVHPNRDTYFLLQITGRKKQYEYTLMTSCQEIIMLVSTTKSSSWRREKISSDE